MQQCLVRGQSFFYVCGMGKKYWKKNSNNRRLNKSITRFGLDNVFKSLSIGS
jgi:hypothetical protein